jgi:hypothetical protein
MKAKFKLGKVSVNMKDQGTVEIDGMEYEFEGSASEIKESVQATIEIVKLQAELNKQ